MDIQMAKRNTNGHTDDKEKPMDIQMTKRHTEHQWTWTKRNTNGYR